MYLQKGRVMEISKISPEKVPGFPHSVELPQDDLKFKKPGTCGDKWLKSCGWWCYIILRSGCRLHLTSSWPVLFKSSVHGRLYNGRELLCPSNVKKKMMAMQCHAASSCEMRRRELQAHEGNHLESHSVTMCRARQALGWIVWRAYQPQRMLLESCGLKT